MQRNWIGKSRGTRVRFAIVEARERSVARSFHHARGYDLRRLGRDSFARRTRCCRASLLGGPASKTTEAEWNRTASQKIVRGADLATAEKEGFFTGRFAVNPFSGEKRAHLGREFCAGRIWHAAR